MNYFMKNVIVLTNNEQHRYALLNDLGYSVQSPLMCMIQTPTKIFNYQIFNVMVSDVKLLDYVKTRDGVIILLNSINNLILDKIDNILNSNSNIPILVYLESNTTNNKILQNRIKSPNHNYLDSTDDNSIYKAKTWINDSVAKQHKQAEPQKEHLGLTSITIPVDLMAEQFQKCTMKLDLWDHYGRLKIVYYSLKKYGLSGTINSEGWLCTNWRKYKSSIGHGNLWNYTLTRFWAHILYNRMHECSDFHSLYNLYPEIQNGRYFQKFYTNDILFSSYAKNHWIEPNLLKI